MHDRAVGVERGDAAVEQGLAEQPGAERAGRGGDVADEVVPGEGRGPSPVGDGLGQRRLLDREERPDLVAGRRHDADRAGQDEQRQPGREREDDARQEHQRGAGDQHATAAEPVGVGREPERDDRVADERQGQHDPDGQRVEAGRGEIEHEDDRQEAVAEHPQRPHREQQASVTIEATQAGDEAGIDGGARIGGGRGGHRQILEAPRARMRAEVREGDERRPARQRRPGS